MAETQTDRIAEAKRLQQEALVRAADEARRLMIDAHDALEQADAALWSAFHGEDLPEYLEDADTELDGTQVWINGPEAAAFYTRVARLVAAANLRLAEYLEARHEAERARRRAAEPIHIDAIAVAISGGEITSRFHCGPDPDEAETSD